MTTDAFFPTRPRYWAHNFEGSDAPKADLQTLKALGRQWLYGNRGRRNGAARALPLRLTGVDPRPFVCDLPAAVLQAKMRPQIESFLTDLSAWAHALR